MTFQTFEDEMADAPKVPSVIENDEEVIFIECTDCEGSGLFAKKTWHEPEIRCDGCNGEGGYEKVVKENGPEGSAS